MILVTGINTLRTFIDLAAKGNFSRVAKRTSVGVNLTLANQRFHHYATSIQSLWQLNQQNVELPYGFKDVVSIGGITLQMFTEDVTPFTGNREYLKY